MTCFSAEDVYAWIIIFVLPLNSAINPLLYTFTTPRYRDRIVTKGLQNALRSKDKHHHILANGHNGSGSGVTNGTTNTSNNSNQGE